LEKFGFNALNKSINFSPTAPNTAKPQRLLSYWGLFYRLHAVVKLGIPITEHKYSMLTKEINVDAYSFHIPQKSKESFTKYACVF